MVVAASASGRSAVLPPPMPMAMGRPDAISRREGDEPERKRPAIRHRRLLARTGAEESSTGPPLSPAGDRLPLGLDLALSVWSALETRADPLRRIDGRCDPRRRPSVGVGPSDRPVASARSG
jgi:hypothetical protein